MAELLSSFVHKLFLATWNALQQGHLDSVVKKKKRKEGNFVIKSDSKVQLEWKKLPCLQPNPNFLPDPMR